jgi:hypothetical protein
MHNPAKKVDIFLGQAERFTLPNSEASPNSHHHGVSLGNGLPDRRHPFDGPRFELPPVPLGRTDTRGPARVLDDHAVIYRRVYSRAGSRPNMPLPSLTTYVSSHFSMPLPEDP